MLLLLLSLEFLSLLLLLVLLSKGMHSLAASTLPKKITNAHSNLRGCFTIEDIYLQGTHHTARGHSAALDVQQGRPGKGCSPQQGQKLQLCMLGRVISISPKCKRGVHCPLPLRAAARPSGQSEQVVLPCAAALPGEHKLHCC
ncbi:unnamed protein product [Polarella glacialis]|uniref:Secreted protein n=1 Tax=Polarella glacialis TaxID=89957 RepID=A0A813GCU9_POLGL|nr:unnamed protein product [Polarella glacialis]